MYQKTFLWAVLLMTAGNLFGQRKADWTTELPTSVTEIFFHSLTGVPIIKGDDFYAGIDVPSHSVKWTVKRSTMQAISAVLGGEEGDDFFEVAFTPFAVVNNTLLDTRDGKILLSTDKDNYKKVFDYEVLPDLSAILVRTNGEGFVKLHLIDMKTGAKKWSSDVLKSSSSLASLVTTKGQAPQVMVPMGTSTPLQSNQLLVFQYKKEIAMINVADGKVVWTEKLDPARTFFSTDQKTAFFIEHDKGGLVSQALSQGAKRMGKEVTAIDVASGKQVWKKSIEADEQIKWFDLQDKNLLIVHAKGCNFYNTEDGKKVWKDDFEAKRIAKIDENTEGYLVSYGYLKTMQLDKNGKKLWKKAQRAPADEDTDVDEEVDFVTYKYNNGSLFLYANKIAFSPIKGGSVKKFSMSVTPETKLEYDESRNMLIVMDNDGVHLINPEKFSKGYLTQEIKVKAEDIQFVEIRKDGYYFSGQEDYIIVKPDGTIKERHYKEPFDGKAFFGNAASLALSVGGAVQQVAGSYNVMKGSSELLDGTYNGSENKTAQGGKKANKGLKQMQSANMMNDAAGFMTVSRHSAFSQTRDFAYFFTKDKTSKEKVLVKISKDSGEELDRLILNDARPIYKVDDVENRVLYADKKEIQVFEPKITKY